MMRSWQKFPVIRGRRSLSGDLSHNTLGLHHQFHATKVSKIEDSQIAEGVPYTAASFEKSDLARRSYTSRRERSAAVSKDIQSLNQNRNPQNQSLQNRIRPTETPQSQSPQAETTSKQRAAPGTSEQQQPRFAFRYSGSRSARNDSNSDVSEPVGTTTSPKTSRYAQGERPAYVRRDAPKPIVTTASPETSRYPQGERPAYVSRDAPPGPRFATRVGARTNQRPRPGVNSGPRRIQRPPQRQRQRQRQDNSDSDFDAADYAAPPPATDLPSWAQARHYLDLAAVETGYPVSFTPARPQLLDLLSMPMGLYAAAGGATRAVGDEVRARAQVREVAVGGTTALAQRLLEGKDILLRDEAERKDVLRRARGLARERAASLAKSLNEREETDTGEDQTLQSAPKDVGSGVNVQKVEFKAADEEVQKDVVKAAIEDVQSKDFGVQAGNANLKTVAGYLENNNTYDAKRGEALMRKVRELLPAATRQGAQRTGQAKQ